MHRSYICTRQPLSTDLNILRSMQKRLKRKEYNTSEEFANDVELVFSNALTFNLERSQIWLDAVTLRVSGMFVERPIDADFSIRTTFVN